MRKVLDTEGGRTQALSMVPIPILEQAQKGKGAEVKYLPFILLLLFVPAVLAESSHDIQVNVSIEYVDDTHFNLKMGYSNGTMPFGWSDTIEEIPVATQNFTATLEIPGETDMTCDMIDGELNIDVNIPEKFCPTHNISCSPTLTCPAPSNISCNPTLTCPAEDNAPLLACQATVDKKLNPAKEETTPIDWGSLPWTTFFIVLGIIAVIYLAITKFGKGGDKREKRHYDEDNYVEERPIMRRPMPKRQQPGPEMHPELQAALQEINKVNLAPAQAPAQSAPVEEAIKPLTGHEAPARLTPDQEKAQRISELARKIKEGL